MVLECILAVISDSISDIANNARECECDFELSLKKVTSLGRISFNQRKDWWSVATFEIRMETYKKAQ